MTKKEEKYRAYFRYVGKHLHKNEYLPINLAHHPTEFRCVINGEEKHVMVNFGWAARTETGALCIDFDDSGTPMPYEGFWEARCFGEAI